MPNPRKYLLFLTIFLIFYLFFLNYNLDYDFFSDEARHANQGFIFYDYFRYIVNEGYIPYGVYVNNYSEKFLITWYATYDPPFHAILQAIMYGLISPSNFSARFTTQLFVVLGAFLLFLLAREITNNTVALCTTVIYLLFPFTYYFARVSFLAIPIAICIVGWYYFLFYKEGRLNHMISMFFLLCATLMKYPSLIYTCFFVAINFIFFLVKEYINNGKKNNGKNSQLKFQRIKEKEEFRLFIIFVVQVIVVLLISYPWLDFSLQKATLYISEETDSSLKPMYTRIFFEGVQRSRESSIDFEFIIFFFRETVLQTFFVALLFIVPFIVNRRKFISRNTRLLIFIASTYILATFLISNKQLRFITQILPFVAIVAVQGLWYLSRWINKKLNIRYTFCILFLLISIILIAQDIKLGRAELNEYGSESDELIEYFSNVSKPFYATHVHIIDELNTSLLSEESLSYHPYFEDVWMFKMLQLKTSTNPYGYDPDKIQAYVSRNNIKTNYELGFYYRYNLTAEYIDTYLIIPKINYYSNLGSSLGLHLQKLGFKIDVLPHYFIFKSVRENRTNNMAFLDIDHNDKLQYLIYRFYIEAREAIKNKDYEKAIDNFYKIRAINPMFENITEDLVKAHYVYAQERASVQDYDSAILILRDAYYINFSQNLTYTEMNNLLDFMIGFLLENSLIAIQQGELEQAMIMIDKALSIDEEFSDVRRHSDQLFGKAYPTILKELEKFVETEQMIERKGRINRMIAKT